MIAELNDYVREDLIDALEPHQVADIAGELDTDDAVAIIEDLEEDDQRAVLAELEPEDRAAIEEALAYPEESAGRLMQRDLIAVPEHWTVGQLIDYLRADEDLTTEFWEVFVVDPQHQPVGTCKLTWILRTPRRIALADVMKRDQTLIPVDMDQEEVALRFQKYALISAAVVDESGPAGRPDHRRRRRPHHPGGSRRGRAAAVRRGRRRHQRADPRQLQSRVRWLIANLVTALVASSDHRPLRGAIEEMVALAVLMPIVAGDRRQCRHPDDGGDGARARHQPAHPLQHLADDLARDPRRAAQRRDRRGR